MTLVLASIHIYPLKAGRAVDLGDSVVEPWGLAGDRRWLVVDADGRFVSQREEPALARVVAAYPAPGRGQAAGGPQAPAGVISLSAAGYPPLMVRAPSAGDQAEMVFVAVWRSKLLAAAAGKEADDWLSDFLGRTVRLVYLDDPTRRQVDQEFGAPGDRVNFADGYPLLLTSTGSLEELGRWLAQDGHPPVPMNRFRPNVVVDGAPPWAEDSWRRIRIGSVTFRVAKPCGRCVVTTIDQATAQRGRQPLAMLGRRRRFGQQLVFGQNMIPDGAGSIRVGDPVHVLEPSGQLFCPAHWRPGGLPFRKRQPLIGTSSVPPRSQLRRAFSSAYSPTCPTTAAGYPAPGSSAAPLTSSRIPSSWAAATTTENRISPAKPGGAR